MATVRFTDRGRERLAEQDTENQEWIKKKFREIRDWPDHFLKGLTGARITCSGLATIGY